VRDTVVECHSGYTYAERPRAFYRDGERIEIETIEAEWHGLEGKHFLVKVKNGSIFELIYDQAGDNWRIILT
jgi:hypothetical protein